MQQIPKKISKSQASSILFYIVDKYSLGIKKQIANPDKYFEQYENQVIKYFMDLKFQVVTLNDCDLRNSQLYLEAIKRKMKDYIDKKNYQKVCLFIFGETQQKKFRQCPIIINQKIQIWQQDLMDISKYIRMYHNNFGMLLFLLNGANFLFQDKQTIQFAKCETILFFKVKNQKKTNFQKQFFKKSFSLLKKFKQFKQNHNNTALKKINSNQSQNSSHSSNSSDQVPSIKNINKTEQQKNMFSKHFYIKINHPYPFLKKSIKTQNYNSKKPIYHSIQNGNFFIGFEQDNIIEGPLSMNFPSQNCHITIIFKDGVLNRKYNSKIIYNQKTYAEYPSFESNNQIIFQLTDIKLILKKTDKFYDLITDNSKLKLPVYQPPQQQQISQNQEEVQLEMVGNMTSSQTSSNSSKNQ